MRTALRTYHPVPSLQKTNGNLQDAPRIKNILKSCYLDDETQGVLPPPTELSSRARSGKVPPASIVNIIFMLSTHAVSIARTHFDRHASFDFLDFFTPIHISSASRARAFLWLCHHYHEGTSYNPFSDDHANAHPGQIPSLVILSPEEAAQENVDPPDEREWGERMTLQRKEFMENKLKEEDPDPSQEKEKPRARGGAARGRRGKGKARDAPEPSSQETQEREREPSPADSISSLPPAIREDPKGRYMNTDEDISDTRARHHPKSSSQHSLESISSSPPSQQPIRYRSPPRSTSLRYPLSSPRQTHHPYRYDPLSDPREIADPYPRRPSTPILERSTSGKPSRTRMRTRHEIPPHHQIPNQYEISPDTQLAQHDREPSLYTYDPAYSLPHFRPFGPPTFAAPRPRPQPQPAPQPARRRSMLEQAWHVVMTTDPLKDSDDEADEHTRLDYVLRLRIISRLRGKEPTPEVEVPPSFFSVPAEPIDSQSGPL